MECSSPWRKQSLVLHLGRWNERGEIRYKLDKLGIQVLPRHAGPATIIASPRAVRLICRVRWDETGKNRSGWIKLYKANNIRKHTRQPGSIPFRLFGKHTLHVDAEMNPIASKWTEPQATIGLVLFCIVCHGALTFSLLAAMGVRDLCVAYGRRDKLEPDLTVPTSKQNHRRLAFDEPCDPTIPFRDPFSSVSGRFLFACLLLFSLGKQLFKSLELVIGLPAIRAPIIFPQVIGGLTDSLLEIEINEFLGILLHQFLPTWRRNNFAGR
jgi:hypothetical protein